MKILVIGSGGREHALVWKIVQSPLVDRVYCAPGNPGTAELAENVAIKVDDLTGLVSFARKKEIDLTVVGPELPLSLGIVDLFEEYGLRIFGARRNAALIEASKAFSKDLMKKYVVPTAAYEVFTEVGPSEGFIRKIGAPIVVKADGLAAGKGGIIAATVDEAVAAVTDMLSGNAFGSAGQATKINPIMLDRVATMYAKGELKAVVK